MWRPKCCCCVFDSHVRPSVLMAPQQLSLPSLKFVTLRMHYWCLSKPIFDTDQAFKPCFLVSRNRYHYCVWPWFYHHYLCFSGSITYIDARHNYQLPQVKFQTMRMCLVISSLLRAVGPLKKVAPAGCCIVYPAVQEELISVVYSWWIALKLEAECSHSRQ